MIFNDAFNFAIGCCTLGNLTEKAKERNVAKLNLSYKLMLSYNSWSEFICQVFPINQNLLKKPIILNFEENSK